MRRRSPVSREVAREVWGRQYQRILFWWGVMMLLFVAGIIARITDQNGLADFFIIAQAAVSVYAVGTVFYTQWKVGRRL